jgi:uncharacterized protein YndB with AHSA1/START domain
VSAPEVAKLRLEREFEATPEEVFDAWTNPEVLARWWMAWPNWDCPGCEVDLRVGGQYVLRSRDGKSGIVHAVAGEYREVDRPRRLVYTWCWQGESGVEPGLVTLVTVDFVALGERTRVVVEHVGLGSEDSRARHGEGWNGAFDSLRERIFGDRAAG